MREKEDWRELRDCIKCKQKPDVVTDFKYGIYFCRYECKKCGHRHHSWETGLAGAKLDWDSVNDPNDPRRVKYD